MYVLWIHLKICSLLTLCSSFYQVPEAVQNSAAVLTSISNSPQAKTCENSVNGAEKMLSRRSRTIMKTPEKRVNVSGQQNDNCQVQWLAVMRIICKMFLTFDSCTGFLAFVYNILGQLYYSFSFSVSFSSICFFYLFHFKRKTTMFLSFLTHCFVFVYVLYWSDFIFCHCVLCKKIRYTPCLPYAMYFLQYFTKVHP